MSHSDVFVSYSSQDRALAEDICRKIERAGIDCWMAPRNVREGEPWPGQILRAIEGARIFLLLLSTHANDSDHVLTEVEHAFTYRLRRLSVRLAQFPVRQDLEYFLKTVQWFEWARKEGGALPVASLLECVVGLLPSREERRRGKRFGPYTVLQREEDGFLHELSVGSSGTGVTYLARESATGRAVALKIVRRELVSEEGAQDCVLRTARAAKVLHHPQVAAVLEPGVERGVVFYAAEYIEGESLHERLRREKMLPPEQVAEIARQVAVAMGVAHAAGLAHGALKPSKIRLLPQNGSDLELKVCGYGFPHDLGSQCDAFATVASSMNEKFAAPELLEGGKPDFCSDVYELAVTLWFLLAGRLPFDGPLAAVVRGHASKPPPVEQLPPLPDQFVSLLNWMLAKDPKQRPQTPRNLVRAIESVQVVLRTHLTRSQASEAPSSIPLSRLSQFGAFLKRLLRTTSPADDRANPSSSASPSHTPTPPSLPNPNDSLFDTLFALPYSSPARKSEAATEHGTETARTPFHADDRPEELREIEQRLEEDSYRLERRDGRMVEVGRGGMGTVYRGFDERHDCAIVVKSMLHAAWTTPELRVGFVQEMRLVEGLHHDHLVEICAVVEAAERVLVVMKFIEGIDLATYVRTHGPQTAHWVLRVAAQMAGALQALEARGIVHSDVKPANIMLEKGATDLAGMHLRLIDLELPMLVRARLRFAPALAGNSITDTLGSFVGTPAFASPEALEGRLLGSQADIYSLGATLWYLFSGQAMFEGSGPQMISAHLTKLPPFERVPHMPAPLVELLSGMLEKDPAKRPMNSAELAARVSAAERRLG